MTQKGRSIFWKVMLVLYLGAVAYLCFASQDGLPKLNEWKFPIPADKCVHFLMFLPWPILSCLAFMPSHKRLRLSSPCTPKGPWGVPPASTATTSNGSRSSSTILLLLGMTLLGLALAGVTEWVQGMLPYRSKDINDFIADSLGLCSGALLFAAFYPFLQRSKTR